MDGEGSDRTARTGRVTSPFTVNMCPQSSQTDAFTVSFVCGKAILYIKYYPKIVLVDDEGPDWIARTREVISAFTVNKRPHLRLIIAFAGHFEC